MPILSRWFAVLTLAAATAAGAQTPVAEPATTGTDLPSTPSGALELDGERVSLDEIRRFVAVFRAVKQAYVEPVDDARLMQAAIRGLLSDLDPHSAYLESADAQALNEVTSGAYDGLGVEVVQQPDRTLLVIAPIDDTPAARAGIRPGDIITQIDGRTIDAGNLESAIESMRGAPGTTMSLTIVRDGEPAPLAFELTRETIRVASARVRSLDPGFAYLRISHFQADTGREVGRKLRELLAGTTPKGLVLDLRSNPGGLMNAAVETADHFLDGGTVVSTRGRLPFSVSEQRAGPGDLLAGAPIVVLIDSGTASAAEVLAAALRDQRRALLMGSPSFGKGSVQTVLPLDNGDSLKLTTARYYTPNGQWIQSSGLQPDLELPENAVLQISRRLPSVRERDLPGHLQAPDESATGAEAAPAADDEAREQDDFAVQQALTVLKGLALFRAPVAAVVRPAQPSANGERP